MNIAIKAIIILITIIAILATCKLAYASNCLIERGTPPIPNQVCGRQKAVPVAVCDANCNCYWVTQCVEYDQPTDDSMIGLYNPNRSFTYFPESDPANVRLKRAQIEALEAQTRITKNFVYFPMEE